MRLTPHQRMALRERQTRLVMDVVVRVFAMAYLVAILIVAPLMLAPTGFAAAAYLWRR
ncbi:MAG TPA: hypothetical protein VFB52_00470 [Solirubrobacterales bacterium]|nr:hypothetical protein [Solirubrobacterales bacterium]